MKYTKCLSYLFPFMQLKFLTLSLIQGSQPKMVKWTHFQPMVISLQKELFLYFSISFALRHIIFSKLCILRSQIQNGMVTFFIKIDTSNLYQSCFTVYQCSMYNEFRAGYIISRKDNRETIATLNYQIHKMPFVSHLPSMQSRFVVAGGGFLSYSNHQLIKFKPKFVIIFVQVIPMQIIQYKVRVFVHCII